MFQKVFKIYVYVNLVRVYTVLDNGVGGLVYELGEDAYSLAKGRCKSRILVSVKVFMTKRHYIFSRQSIF